MDRNTGTYKDLPGVDTLLGTDEVKALLAAYPRELVLFSVQSSLESYRSRISEGETAPGLTAILQEVRSNIRELTSHSLRKVINATGVIIHTNIGRSPLGDAILDEVRDVLTGYSNLEFDLVKAKRGTRYSHLTGLLRYLTGAEDILVVNNNAAAVLLILHTLARKKEVIISRGELIEIGGSFRMPDIMKTSDCRMIEVGTTNKTRLEDYERAITPRTALLMKAHRSNYVIKGFTHQPSLKELAGLANRRSLPLVYDMGSGLLRKSGVEILKDEPDVQQTLAEGADLVSFSGDKLLGGPQAGIIAGKRELVARLKKDPLTRALRVGKTTLALLEAACLQYLDEGRLVSSNPVFSMLHLTPEEIRKKAMTLQKELTGYNITSDILPNSAQTGGGSLPEAEIPSFAVQITGSFNTNRERAAFAEKLYRDLLIQDLPVLGILRKGQVLFDMLAVPDKEIPLVAQIIHQAFHTHPL